MEFSTSVDEDKIIADWNKEHVKTCECYKNQGAIGGRLTYTFTMTGLGLVTKVKCACGEEKDVTDYENW